MHFPFLKVTNEWPLLTGQKLFSKGPCINNRLSKEFDPQGIGVAFLLCFHNFRPLSSILSRDTQSSKVLLVSTFDLSHMITSSSLWKIPHLNYPLIVYKYSKVEVSPKLKFNHYLVTLVSMERRVKAASFAQGCLDNGCVFILEWTIPYRLHE